MQFLAVLPLIRVEFAARSLRRRKALAAYFFVPLSRKMRCDSVYSLECGTAHQVRFLPQHFAIEVSL